MGLLRFAIVDCGITWQHHHHTSSRHYEEVMLKSCFFAILFFFYLSYMKILPVFAALRLKAASNCDAVMWRRRRTWIFGAKLHTVVINKGT